MAEPSQRAVYREALTELCGMMNVPISKAKVFFPHIDDLNTLFKKAIKGMFTTKESLPKLLVPALKAMNLLSKVSIN